MRDQKAELIYYPCELLALDGVERVLCVAPHPDDEVLGCGGLLALLAARGCHIETLILTGGESALGQPSQAHAAQRRQESLAAANVLGCPPPYFLDFSDRQLKYSAPLLQALREAFARCRPELLLLPSLSEPHPDHQATALAGLAVAQQRGADLTVLFYEVGAPLHANAYADITAVADRKWQAVAQFGSQLGIERYEEHARALASLRAFGLGPDCRAAEAFFHVDAQAVAEHGALAALPQWPWVRSRMHLANAPEQLPLVSVLIRSMDRPCLAEALASVALQTYSNLEVVVVNGSGRPHSALIYPEQRMPVTLVQPDRPVPCGRAVAANLALQHAQGEWALFLDDDDLLLPEHIEKLAQALLSQSQAVGAYSGVRVEDANGAVLRRYDLPWSRHRLNGINFLPIHAVLFRMDRVRAQEIRFDETLPVLEDWDFWKKLTRDADLLHCPGISAVYRQALGSSGIGDPLHNNHWQPWHAKLLEQFVSSQSVQDLSRNLAWHAIALDGAQSKLEEAQAKFEQAHLKLADVQSKLTETSALSEQHLAARDALQFRIAHFSEESQTALAAKEQQLQELGHEMQTALAAKEQQLQELGHEMLAALEAKEAQLNAYAQNVQTEFDKKERQIADLSRQWAQLQEQLQWMESSRGWRFTQLLKRFSSHGPR